MEFDRNNPKGSSTPKVRNQAVLWAQQLVTSHNPRPTRESPIIFQYLDTKDADLKEQSLTNPFVSVRFNYNDHANRNRWAGIMGIETLLEVLHDLDGIVKIQNGSESMVGDKLRTANFNIHGRRPKVRATPNHDLSETVTSLQSQLNTATVRITTLEERVEDLERGRNRRVIPEHHTPFGHAAAPGVPVFPPPNGGK